MAPGKLSPSQVLFGCVYVVRMYDTKHELGLSGRERKKVNEVFDHSLIANC